MTFILFYTVDLSLSQKHVITICYRQNIFIDCGNFKQFNLFTIITNFGFLILILMGKNNNNKNTEDEQKHFNTERNTWHKTFPPFSGGLISVKNFYSSLARLNSSYLLYGLHPVYISQWGEVLRETEGWGQCVMVVFSSSLILTDVALLQHRLSMAPVPKSWPLLAQRSSFQECALSCVSSNVSFHISVSSSPQLPLFLKYVFAEALCALLTGWIFGTWRYALTCFSAIWMHIWMVKSNSWPSLTLVTLQYPLSKPCNLCTIFQWRMKKYIYIKRIYRS